MSLERDGATGDILMGSWSWLLAAAALLLCATAALLVVEEARAVVPPDGTGPYAVGYSYADVQTSTKAYATPVKVYYPATVAGQDAAPNLTAAPYPAVVWLPGFGGNRDMYGLEVVQPLSSWGFVVMAVSVNWADFPNSADPDDVNDLLTWLDSQGQDPSSDLHGMVDNTSYGISGHSSGGGLSLLDGAMVDRIKAVQPFAAAIDAGTVDSLAQYFHKPVVLQTGAQDATYIEGSRRAYQKFTCTRSLVEITSAGHGGPFVIHTLVAFYLYWLDGRQEYRTFLYGPSAMDDVAAGKYTLYFNVSGGEHFPPILSARVTPADVDMDSPVALNGSMSGYYPLGHPAGAFAWDVDGDGKADVADASSMNQTWAYTAPGVYNVTFTYTLGRFSIGTPKPIRVTVHNVPPVAVLGWDVSVDQDATLALDASSSRDTPSDMGHLEYVWLFEGDAPVTTQVPRWTHTCTKVGAFTVTLTVRDPHGAESSALVNVTVANVPPTARAGDGVTVNEDQSFDLKGTGNDTPSDVPRLKFRWDFGDGYDTDWAPYGTATHSYAQAGNHTATLWVKDGLGATASSGLTVTVSNLPPTGDIVSPVDGAVYDEDKEISFRGTGSDTPTDIDSLRFRWDFGDGSVTGWESASGADQVHTFTRAGNHTVTLTVIDDDGATFKGSIKIVIMNPAPRATIVRPGASLVVDEDSSVAFEGSASDTVSQNGNLSYIWQIGGIRLEGQVVDFTFIKTGTYDAVLTVTDPEGATDSASGSVRVRNVVPEVTASLSPLAIKEKGSVAFASEATDTPTDLPGLILLWDFGDGVNTTALNGNHTYVKAGNYTVTFSATDDDGAMATQTFRVRVEAATPSLPINPPDNGGSKEGLSTAAYAGIAIVVVVVLLLVVLFLRMRKGRNTT